MTTPGFADPGLSYILGDVDFSGKVDSGDLSSILGAFGAGSGGANGNPLGGLDTTPSGGGLSGAAANVPEPTSLGLLGLGAAGMLIRRKKRRA